ncbi:uncharacterized protein LOC115632411 isoform X2 [Scaptodrosophila lebanonensis]|uniref:Uncharacterized protein LOC115632411 isoform X2 n=1 Tax=Drosophila lebanonensis TaxID=7225 RepID=A0A6J2UAN5_DROLE|nr:uncharacterized protein LOC115632411 isoform X2 [Scaptodrosophila lebanonensis]
MESTNSNSNNKNGGGKNNKKGRKTRAPQNQQQQEKPQPPQQHHPWDEVSLPGAGIGPTEQPTILLINNQQQQQQQQQQHHPESQSPSQQLNGEIEAESEAQAGKESKAAKLKLTLDSSKNQSASIDLAPTTPGGSHVLDIESHLIEDANTYTATEEQGVGINELQPIEYELEQGTSKVETDDASRVIEVEPAGAKTKQIVETQAPSHQTAEVDETTAQADLVSQPAPNPSEVREAAEQLVNEIERELVENLSRHLNGDHKNVDDEQTKTDSGDIKEHLEAVNSLSQQVDAQLNELTSILKNKLPESEIVSEQQQSAPLVLTSAASSEIKLVEVPTPKTQAEEEQRKAFIDSLPQIEQRNLLTDSETDANRLSADCKREYYQSLKKYLLHSSQDRPPVPLQTYRWEDLRRAKERGGYPWTHLYKRPLGPDEEPEIVLLLRKSQELRFKSESPKSLKRVRYDEQVLVKETERYIQDLSEDEAPGDSDQSSEESDTDTESVNERDPHNEDALSECISCVSDSVLAVGGHAKPRKTNRLAQIRNLIKRRRSGRTQEDAQSLPGNSANASLQSSVHELAPPPGSLVPNSAAAIEQRKAEKRKPKQSFDIMKKLKSLAERQKKRLNIKRISLKKDEKIVLGEEQKIMRLKASPKSDRGEIPHFIEKQDSDDVLELVEYDESPCRKRNKEEQEQAEDLPTSSSNVLQPDEVIELPQVTEPVPPTVEVTESEAVSKVDDEDETVESQETADDSAPPKKTPRLRREHVYEEIGQQSDSQQPLLEASSVDALKKSLMRQDNLAVDEVEAAKSIPLDRMGSSEEEQAAALTADKSSALLAPISSIDSTSSDEERARLAQLSPVAEESDVASNDALEIEELRPSIKKEPSPAPSDKKVTFSHVEDEAEPHREDIELPENVLEAATNAAKLKNVSDHEYEPIGVAPTSDVQAQEPSSATPSAAAVAQNGASIDNDAVDDRYLSSAATTPRTESRTDYEIHTSQVDSSALEELPLQPENRKKGFMATAQDRTRKMQDGIRNQAGKIRTKLRPQPKKPVSGSPKAKERRRFKAPEFSKIKMPEIKRPDMTRFKDMKRPEFTKFNKPDMSKFKLPEKFPTLKLRRSKSFKENEAAVGDSELPTESTESPNAEAAPAPKKKFEFNFGTYPRAFRKKKPAEPVAVESSLGTEGLSVIPSTETQPSSTSSPQGDRGPGPVRSRWADKFSDVSYNDSEGSRYRRYGSELESFDRESSLERRMKEDLEDTGSEAQPQQQKLDLGILGGVADSKQFAEFDEENRAIHEISNLRSREFKRRPMVHQDSDLRSEDSRDAEGWTEKDIQKNKLLRKAELEAETGYYKYHSGEEGLLQDAQSTASSGKKVVMEEIDDDEFFLRKRGISEDNIQLRQYISAAIREGYDMPNALQNVGQEYGDYDVPPPKPRRLHKNYRPEYGDSQEFQRSDYGDDLSMSQNGSDFMPKRPLRKARSRSKYSMDSQDIPMADDGSQVQYFDDDEEYLRPPARDQAEVEEPQQGLNNLSFNAKASSVDVPRPHAPRRQKKRTRDQTSVEKEQADDFINGFGGRSVSNTFLQPQEDVIVYRTEHEYHIPLATPDNFTDGASARTQRSEDERTSRGADSLALDAQAPENELPQEVEEEPQHEKFVIDMLENDGYAVVRKEQMPKPTPPARRKKFTRSPGERFATLPSTRGSPPPPARPPPPQRYTPSDDSPLPPRRRSPSIEDIGLGAGIKSNEPSQAEQPVEEEEEEDDYEALERPESPRANLQSGDVINKMKYRPLPPPPRPPREKRQRGGSTVDSKGERTDDELSSYRYEDSERVASSSTADSYDQHEFEVEVSTQTDPLPDDFVCEEFEITEDMKVIEPRRSNGTKTLDDLLRSAQSEQDELDGSERPLTEDEQLARGLQRFRDANQRSMSERSRASSQADRSKSLSRPQTPSAVVIERRVPTPSPTGEENDSTVQAALIVRPISVADLEDDDLRREEEALRREGLLSDSSVQSKSDVETAGEDEELHGEQGHIALSDYAPSSADLDAAVEQLQQAQLESDYESKLEDDEVERTLRESEYEDDEVKGEKYSDHYDEDEELKLQEQVLRRELGLDLEQEQQLTDQEQQLTDQEQQLTDQELEEALEKELQEEMEKELAAYRKTEAPSSQIQELSSVEAVTTPEYPLSEEEPEEKIVTEEPLLSSEIATQLKSLPKVDTSEEVAAKFISSEPLDDEAEHEPPHPPPRRKSTTVLEPTSAPTLTIAEQATRELTPVQSVQSATTQPQAQLPSRLAELEVERLRVHALQAGQIMVSQLHGSQISSDELECKSGNLVVKNIELPPGFIEDIVERVRSSEPRASLLTTETQTSRQPSSEPAASEETDLEVEKPLKPPRQSKLTETAAPTTSSHSNLDEQTQTDAALLPLPPPPTVYPSVEYLQSLAPLAFYNLQRSGEAEQAADASPSSTADRKAPHKCRRRHVQRREEQYEDDEQLGSGSDLDVELVERPRSRRSRTRSGTQPSEAFDEHEPKTVVQAGRQFISACSLELVNIINQLTNYVRGDVVEQQQQQQGRNLPALMVLFILITFGVLVFLLTGRQVHTHHWDYFNPPGNEGRQT